MKIITDAEFRELEASLGAKILYSEKYFGFFLSVTGIEQNVTKSLLDASKVTFTTCPALINRALDQHQAYYNSQQTPLKKAWLCRMFGC